MSGIFKAYDVRGLYPEQINEEIARQIGLAFHNVLDEADQPFHQGNEAHVHEDDDQQDVPNLHVYLRCLDHCGAEPSPMVRTTAPVRRPLST